MLEDVIEKAKKVSEKIAEDEESTVVSNEFVDEVTGDGHLTPNQMALLRHAIPFVGDTPIVPERHANPRQRTFRPMTKTEFEDYELTDQNFLRLSTDEITKIKKRIKKAKPNIPAKEILRLLTLCDMLVQSGARKGYISYRKGYTAYSVNITKEELEERLRFLEHAGIISISSTGKVRFNEVFVDMETTTSASDNIRLPQKTEAEMRIQKKNHEEAKMKLGEIQEYIENLQQENEAMQRQIAILEAEKYQLNDSFLKMKESSDNIPVILAAYKDLENSTEKVVAGRIRDYRNLVLERVTGIFVDASGKMKKIFDDERQHKSTEPLEFRLNALLMDVMKSVQVAVKAKGILSNSGQAGTKK